MRYKIGTYPKSLCIGLLCLLMFATSHMGHAALKIYYIRAGDAFWEKTLWRMDANGNNKELVLKPPVPMIQPALSPDGQHLLFATKKVGGEDASKLMVMNLDGSNLRKLLADPPRPGSSRGKWSPDGKWVAYFAFDPDRRPNKDELFVTDTQGLNSFQIAADLEDAIVSFGWLPDSKKLVLSIAKPLSNGKLFWVDADPNAMPKAMDVEIFAESIDWSPNGEQTVVVGWMRVRGGPTLFLGDALGKNLIRLDAAEEAFGARWLPDNKHIVYTSGFDPFNVAVMNADTQAVKRLTNDGRSAFAFWRDSTLAVEPKGKLSTSWGAIKAQVIAAKK